MFSYCIIYIIGNIQSSCAKEGFTAHSSITTDEAAGAVVYIWGGYHPSVSCVHSTPEKLRFTSSVHQYSMLDSTYDRRKTKGSPPNATIHYSCCGIGNDIYYFGGSCQPSNCYHNDLFVLKTDELEWREIQSASNGPMAKGGCGMVSLYVNNEDCVLVIGGLGPTCATNNEIKCIESPDNESLCYTNEVHVMHLSGMCSYCMYQ